MVTSRRFAMTADVKYIVPSVAFGKSSETARMSLTCSAMPFIRSYVAPVATMPPGVRATPDRYPVPSGVATCAQARPSQCMMNPRPRSPDAMSTAPTAHTS